MEIEEFIKRRFPKDCDWTTGNCYWFAVILSERFGLDIYYMPITGHFVAGDGEYYYDYNGLLDDCNEPIILFDDIKKDDPIHYERLVDNCVK